MLQGVTALVVDDDADTRKSVARILRLAGADVSVTGSVEGALQLIEKNRWDVVVTEIGMPVLSGYELIRVAQRPSRSDDCRDGFRHAGTSTPDRPARVRQPSHQAV